MGLLRHLTQQPGAGFLCFCICPLPTLYPIFHSVLPYHCSRISFVLFHIMFCPPSTSSTLLPSSIFCSFVSCLFCPFYYCFCYCVLLRFAKRKIRCILILLSFYLFLGTIILAFCVVRSLRTH